MSLKKETSLSEGQDKNCNLGEGVMNNDNDQGEDSTGTGTKSVKGTILAAGTDHQENGLLLNECTEQSESERPSIPDGGYGWLVVAAASYISMVAVGTIMCYGVVYVEFLDFFQEGRTWTSFIGSLCTLAGAIGGPIAGTLAVRFGHRSIVIVGCLVSTTGMAISAFAVNIYYLYFSFGILTGFGVGLSLIPSLAIVGQYFDKRLALASGVALSGGGLSYIVFPFVSEACIRAFTWRGTMFILAGLWIQGCVFGALMRPLEVKGQTKTKDGGKKKVAPPMKCDLDLFRTWQFWAYMLEEYLWHIDFMNFVVILPDFAVLSGHTTKRAALLLTLIGVFIIPSRLLGGYVTDIVKVSPVLLLSGGLVALATSSIVLPFTKRVFEILAAVCAFRGVLHGVLVSLLPKVIVVLFSREKLTVMIGYTTLSVMFGQLSAPPLGAFIYDKTGDYLYAYITCAIITYVTALIPFSLYFDARKKKAKEPEIEEEMTLKSKNKDSPA